MKTSRLVLRPSSKHTIRRPSVLDRSFTRIFAAALACVSAHAASLTWDITPGVVGVGDSVVTGGLGTWNLANGNWTADAGATNVAWLNGATPDDAIFSGVVGAVTLGEPVTVGNITFLSGYNITGSTLTLGSATPTITGTGVLGIVTSSIAGSNGLTLQATGTAGVYLDGNNTYSGVTTVNSGFLVARNAGSLGSALDGTVIASGATLQVEAIGLADVNITNEALTISGTGMLGNRGALASWAGNNTWGGPVAMAANSSILIQAGTLAVNGVLSGTGFNLSKTGAGQLTLGGSASNTFTGTTTIDLGTLALGKTGGAKAIIGPVTMGGVNTNQPNLRMLANNQFDPSVVMTFVNASGNWARFDLQGTSQTLAGIQCATGGGIVQNERISGGGTSAAGTLTINNSADYSFTGYMRDRDGGAGTYFLNIVKTGAGKQTIAGANVTYTGTTTVNNGTLELSQTTAYNSSTTVNTGGTFRNIGAASANYNAATLTLNGGAYTHATTAANAWRVWNPNTGPLTIGAAGGTINVENTNTTNNNVYFDGGIAGAGTLTLNTNGLLNNGIVFRTQVGSYSGDVQVNTGNLFVNATAGLVLQNSNVTLAAGGALRLDANWASSAANASVKSVNGAGTITLGAQTLTVGTNNGSGAFAGVIGGTGGLVKTGTGSQTLSGANTFSGPTSVNNGTLVLDYSTQDNSKLSNTAALTLSGATLALNGGTHPEVVLSTALTAGTASTITRTGNSVLQMNTITRNPGASLNFSAPGIATTDNANDASGILGTWATVGGDWAMNSTGGADGAITAYSAYTDANRLGGSIANAATANVRIIEAGASGNVTLAAGGTTTINSLVQSAAGGAATVDIGAGNTLRLGAAGGVLLPSGNPALGLSNGTLTAGGADNTAGNLDVNNLSATTGITIDSIIANNGTGVVSLTKLGAGAVTVTGANSHTGGTNIIGGALAFNSGSLGTTGTITMGAGTLRWNGSNTEDVSARTTLVNGLTATFDTNGNNVTFASAIGGATSAGVTKAGNGTLTLSAANTHTGVTTVQGGALALNNVGSLQSSTLDTGTAGPQSVNFAIAGNNTYNIGGLQGADALEIGGNTVSIGGNNSNTNFSGVVNGTGGALTKVGTGVLTLSGASSNTFTGATTFAANGQLILSKTGGAVAIPGDFTMAAPGIRGIVSATQDNQFAPGSVLRFTSAGDTRLELKGTTQTFGGIDNSTAPAHTYHAIQHSEFGSVAPVDTTSQLVLDVAGANAFNFSATAANGSIRDYYGGTMSLVKNGTGSQKLTGAGFNYSGPTAVNAGTFELADATGYNSNTTVATNANLILSNTANMGMGTGAAFTLNNGATLTHNGVTANSAYITLAGPFTVAGATTINENSATNVTAINKNLFLDGGLHGSGTLTINALNPGNAVELRNNNSTFAGTIIVNGIPSATVNAGSGMSVGGTTTALQNADITLNGTMELLNQGLGWAGTAPGDFAMGALNGTGVMVANFTSGGETRVKMGSTNNNGTFSGAIVDGTGNRVVLTKVGTGTQILAGNNAYTGTTVISGGTLQFGTGGTEGAIGTGAIVNNGALVINRSNDLSINTVISGTGSVTKSGAGTLTLTSNSTYSGATTINGGTIKLGASATLPVSSAIWLDATDSGTIQTNLDGVTAWLNKGTLGAAGDAVAAIGQEPSIVGSEPAMNNKPVVRFDAAPGGGAPFDRLVNTQNFTAGNVTVMYAGRLTGGANFRLVSANGNNWLLGTWGGNGESAYFNNGFLYNTVVPDTASRIFTGTIATGGAANFYVNSVLRGSGVGAQGPNGLSLGGGYSDGINPPNSEFSDGDIGEMLVFTSVLTTEERGAVEGYLNRKWRGGNTNILPATTAVSLTSSGSTLDLSGVNQTVASLSGVAGTNVLLGGGKLTVGNATNTVFAGAISGGGFTKVGTGTLELSGVNTPSGDPVTVQAGTLLVTGSLSGSNVEVQNGGTIGGSGTIGSDVYVLAGGKISPGTSPGTLTVTGTQLDFSDGVTAPNTQSLIFELGTASDRVNLTAGQFNIGTGVLEFDDFAFTAGSGFGPGTYTLFDSTQDVFGGLGAAVTGTIGGLDATLSLADTNNDVLLTVVPEPGSATLLLGGLALVAARRRRK